MFYNFEKASAGFSLWPNPQPEVFVIDGRNFFKVVLHILAVPRVARSSQPLGFETEPLQGSQRDNAKIQHAQSGNDAFFATFALSGRNAPIYSISWFTLELVMMCISWKAA